MTPLVEVHADAEELATSVAGALLTRVADVQQLGREPQIALTGGSIADRLHAETARLTPDSGVDWSRVGVWWGDERFVAPDSPDRNSTGARRALLDAVGAARVHEMPSTADAADVHAGAAAYADQLRAEGGGEFEVVILGLGPDGHVASLFPGRPEVDVRDRVAVGVTDSPKPPPDRISLTVPALCRTRSVWFIVSGEAKADAVAAALGEQPDPDVPANHTPARLVGGRLDTIWFVDSAAASRL